MKQVSKGFLFILITILSIGLFGCEPNKCTQRGTYCKNSGVCNGGNCQCSLEWEGDSCQYPVNKKFISQFWGILAQDGQVPGQDTITVEAGTKNTTITFKHISGLVNRINRITFSGSVKNNEINIEPFVSPANGYTYKGNGSLNKDVITLTMRMDTFAGGVSLGGANYTFAGNRVK
jgi:hypothetical protein